MRQLVTMVSVALLLVLPILAEAETLQARRADPQAARPYNPADETTVEGTIQEIRQYPQGAWTGTHLMLRTAGGVLDVHLGPSQYLEQIQLAIHEGDRVTVTGARTDIAGAQALLAREVRKEGRTFALRNQQGIPLWSGGPAMGTGMGTGRMGRPGMPGMAGQQAGRGMRGTAGRASPGARVYQPETEATLEGTVAAVQELGWGPWTGTHVQLDSTDGTVWVHLGPSQFLSSQKLQLKKGNRLTVTGSRVEMDGQDVIIARQVQSGGTSVTLRNEQGVPVWSGGGRRYR